MFLLLFFLVFIIFLLSGSVVLFTILLLVVFLLLDVDGVEAGVSTMSAAGVSHQFFLRTSRTFVGAAGSGLKYSWRAVCLKLTPSGPS